MKDWKNIFSMRRMLALLLTLSIVTSMGSGISVRADNKTSESATVTSEKKAQQPTLSKTMKWDFNDSSQLSDFTLYQSGTSRFSIKDGMLMSNGTDGEMKAILDADIDNLDSISVDIIPGESGVITSGVYLGADRIGNAVDEIDALIFLTESHFSGWGDAPNRVDLVMGKFSDNVYTELQRDVSESGKGNALFSGGNKQPLNLRLNFNDNMIVGTLSLISNPNKVVQFMYEVDSKTYDGKIGLRASHTDVCYDNLTITYKSGVLPEASIYDFSDESQQSDFTLYQSGTSQFAVKDGVLVPNGTDGEVKAILNADVKNIKSASVDIIPGESGSISAAMYIGAYGVGHGAFETYALAFFVESHFVGWDDAPNRVDLIAAEVVASPAWKEYERTVTETGLNNALFKDKRKEPVNLQLDFDENKVTATLRLISNPEKYVQKTYEIDSSQFDGKFGLSAYNGSDVRLDNLKMTYEYDSNETVKTYMNEGYNFSKDSRLWESTMPLDEAPNTFESWVKVPKGVTNGATGVIVSSRSFQPAFSLEMCTYGRPRLYWRAENSEIRYFDADVDLRTGEWTHIAYVCDVDSDKVTCYINGKAVNTWREAEVKELTPLDNVRPLQKFYLGNIKEGHTACKFVGWIADVRIWSKPLSEAAIKQSMMTQYTSVKEGLLYNAPSDKTVDNVFKDLSGNENHMHVYERELNWIEEKQEPTDYSIAVIPDQQYLTAYYEDKLYGVYEWIEDNVEKENIQMVLNLGDITDDNSDTHWQRALDAYNVIKGKVPYICVPGNHDYVWSGAYRDLTNMNKYFPLSLFEDIPTYGGSYSQDNNLPDNSANMWQEFEIYGNKYLVLALELGPRDQVLEWANKVVAEHPDHQVIVTTHAYMNYDGTLLTANDDHLPSAYESTHSATEPANNPDSMWEKFVKKHENIIMVLSGHVYASDNIVMRTDIGEHGNEVKQFLIDAQLLDVQFGGFAMLGMLRFSERGTKCTISYYSPSKDKCLNECNQFTITLPEQKGIYDDASGDKKALTEAVNKAEVLNGNDYTATSWKLFKVALDKAKKVLDDESAKQHIINQAVIELQESIDALIRLTDGYQEVIYTFTDASEADDFSFYHTSDGSYKIKNGKLIADGEDGEFKAILEKNGRVYQSVSVDILLDDKGEINAGIYLGASDANNTKYQIDALAILAESFFTGWDDAPNRVDCTIVSFPGWKEISRTVSETGLNNALFTNKQKQPLNMKIDINGDIVTITLSLRDDASKYIKVTCEYTGECDLERGYIGLCSESNGSAFDNLRVVYKQYLDKKALEDAIADVKDLLEEDYTIETWNALQATLKEAEKVLDDKNVTQDEIDVMLKNLKKATEALALSDLYRDVTYTFTNASEAEDFSFYHTSAGDMKIKDGKLVTTGKNGEYKAILEKNGRVYKSISVDILIDDKGEINAGIYLGVSDAYNAEHQIDALAILAESFFTGWDDAPNRVDCTIVSFPGWKELSRTVSETGLNNALFTNKQKQPLNMKVDIDGNIVIITLSLRDNHSKYIQVVYEYTGDCDLEKGYIGLRSSSRGSSFDNLHIVYKQYLDKTRLNETIAEVESMIRGDYSEEKWRTLQEVLKQAKKVSANKDASQKDVDAVLEMLEKAMYNKIVYNFTNIKQALDFDFYRSLHDGFNIKDGKLTVNKDLWEVKAILKGTNRAYKSVSVDIYPDEDGMLDAGLYIHAAGAGYATDKIHALGIVTGSYFTGWDDAPNRIDIIVGEFPVWKELSRTVSETGLNNALYTNGKKEPLNLKIDIEEKVIAITVSLLRDPSVFVQSVYEYTGDGNLTHGRVGVISKNFETSFDNFTVEYKNEVYSEDELIGAITPEQGTTSSTTSPNTGDNMGAILVFSFASVVVSFSTVILLLYNKRKRYGHPLK